MILGFVYKNLAERKRLGRTSWRAVLKYAWLPKVVVNEAISGPDIVTADQLQLIWLEHYSIIEHYNQDKGKWIKNSVQPFINPDEKTLNELSKPEFKETELSWFLYWEIKKKRELAKETIDLPYKVEPILNTTDTTITYQGT